MDKFSFWCPPSQDSNRPMTMSKCLPGQCVMWSNIKSKHFKRTAMMGVHFLNETPGFLSGTDRTRNTGPWFADNQSRDLNHEFWLAVYLIRSVPDNDIYLSSIYHLCILYKLYFTSLCYIIYLVWFVLQAAQIHNISTTQNHSLLPPSNLSLPQPPPYSPSLNPIHYI